MRMGQVVAWVISLLITASLFAGMYMFLNRYKLPGEQEVEIKTLDELHSTEGAKKSGHEEEPSHEDKPASQHEAPSHEEKHSTEEKHGGH